MYTHRDNVSEPLQTDKAFNTLLAEVDPKVSDDTFCVITKNWGQTFVHRFNQSPSLNLFYPYSPIRRAAIAFTTHLGYDIGLMVIVIGNLISLALPRVMPSFFQYVSILFYSAETIYQSISRGFIFGTYSYLRNPWMCFDFIITFASSSTLSDVSRSTFGLQSLRGIRILNLITRVPGVRTMAHGTIQALSQMYGVTLMFFLFLISVAMTAKHIFKGVILQKCVKEFPSNSNLSYTEFIRNEDNWLKEDDHYFTCGNLTGARSCPKNYVCLRDIIGGPHANINFDNFGSSLLNSFSIVIHDEWDELFDEVTKATGHISALFFIPIVFFGSFCLLNLMLIVVVSSYRAVIDTKKEKDLSVYSYHSHFKYNTEKLSLYPLPTNEETLKRALQERDDLLHHQEVIRNIYESVIDKLTFKQIQKPYQTESHKISHQVRNVSEDIGLFNSFAYYYCLLLISDKTQGLCKRFRLKIKKLTQSKLFRYSMLFTIIVSVIFEASEHADKSPNIARVLWIGDQVFLSVYIFEMICMLIAQGIYYFFSCWNLLDVVVIIDGIGQILYENMGNAMILKSLRLLKLLKIQKEWTVLQRLTAIILDSIGDVIRLIIVMSLSIFVFAIIGNRLLGPLYDYESDPKKLRWSFATFGGSLFTVFKTFTGDWIDDFWGCMNKTESSSLCPIIFISYFLIGNLVIINLFAALLISSFDTSKLLPAKKTRFGDQFFKKASDCIGSLFPSKKKRLQSKSEGYKGNVAQEKQRETNHLIDEVESKGVILCVQEFIRSNKFEYIVYVIILGSCIVMALDDVHAEKNLQYSYVLTLLNLLFAALLVIEMFLRWIGYGIKTYFTNGWTLFDFFLIMVTSIEIVLVYGFKGTQTISSLRVLRALRPLRLTANWKGMRMIIEALILALPSMFRLWIVFMFIWLPFAITGVHYQKSRFYRCANAFNKRIEDHSITNKTDCLQANYFWKRAFFNYDNIANSFLSLILLSLLSDWSELAELMLDSVGGDQQPKKDAHPQQYIYIVVFILIGGFFCSNLFIGVAVDCFKNKHTYVEHGISEMSLTEKQKKYYRAMKTIGKRKPVLQTNVPSHKCLFVFYRISVSFWFRVLIFIIICANTIIIALNSHHNPPLMEKIIETSGYVFTFIYVLEFLIKILGLGKYYFYDSWNILDFSILVLYLIGDVICFVTQSSINLMSFLYAIRIFRIFQFLHLKYIFLDIRLLINAMTASFSSLLCISALLFLTIFIYSVIGIQLFGHIKHSSILNSHVNFETMISSVFLLFRLSTVEGWGYILQELSLEPPDCDPLEPISNCGSKGIATIFLLTYIFLTNVLLVNIFIAVILDNYQEAMIEENDIFKEDNLISFYKSWVKYDPKATHFISYENLSEFLDSLKTELRIPRPNYITIAYMNLPLAAGSKVHCLNVLKGILKVKYGQVEDTPEFHSICNVIEKKHQKCFPELKGFRFIQTTMQLQQIDRAARIIQAYVNRFREKKAKKSDVSLLSKDTNQRV